MSSVFGPVSLSTFEGQLIAPFAPPCYDHEKRSQLCCCHVKSALVFVGVIEIILNLLSIIRVLSTYFVVVSTTASIALLIIIISFACLLLWSVHHNKASGVIPITVLEYVALIFLVASLVMFVYTQARDPAFSADPNFSGSWNVLFYVLSGFEICWKLTALYILHKGYLFLKCCSRIADELQMRGMMLFPPGANNPAEFFQSEYGGNAPMFLGQQAPGTLPIGYHPNALHPVTTAGFGANNNGNFANYPAYNQFAMPGQDAFFYSSPVEEIPPPPAYNEIVTLHQPPKYPGTTSAENVTLSASTIVSLTAPPLSGTTSLNAPAAPTTTSSEADLSLTTPRLATATMTTRLA